MITSISICSKMTFQNNILVPDISAGSWKVKDSYQNGNFISILDPGNSWGIKDGERYMTLWFDDIDPEFHTGMGARHAGEIPFDNDMGKQVIAFLDEIEKRPGEEDLYIHCTMGISRSGAIGSFACDYLGLDYNEFKNQNPWIQPNAYVTSILNRLRWGVTQ